MYLIPKWLYSVKSANDFLKNGFLPKKSCLDRFDLLTPPKMAAHVTLMTSFLSFRHRKEPFKPI